MCVLHSSLYSCVCCTQWTVCKKFECAIQTGVRVFIHVHVALNEVYVKCSSVQFKQMFEFVFMCMLHSMKCMWNVRVFDSNRCSSLYSCACCTQWSVCEMFECSIQTGVQVCIHVRVALNELYTTISCSIQLIALAYFWCCGEPAWNETNLFAHVSMGLVQKFRPTHFAPKHEASTGWEFLQVFLKRASWVVPLCLWYHKHFGVSKWIVCNLKCDCMFSGCVLQLDVTSCTCVTLSPAACAIIHHGKCFECRTTSVWVEITSRQDVLDTSILLPTWWSNGVLQEKRFGLHPGSYSSQKGSQSSVDLETQKKTMKTTKFVMYIYDMHCMQIQPWQSVTSQSSVDLKAQKPWS